MEDRYLFRAKRIDNGEWVEGYLSYPFCTKKGNESYYFYAKDSLVFFCRCVVDASTISQCTGLKDKNGKLIWENDVVGRLEIHKVDEPTVGIIEYDIENTAFIIHWLDKPKYSAVFPWKEKIQVIGNEFDNLKQKARVDMNKKEEINNYNKIRLKKRADPKRKARIVNRLLKANFKKT